MVSGRNANPFARRGGGIVIADANGRHQVRVTNRGSQPAWSPDGSRLVFTRSGWLDVVGTNGQGLRRLFPGWDPDWSPDGTRLALSFSERQDGLNDVYVAALDGSEASASRRRRPSTAAYSVPPRIKPICGTGMGSRRDADCVRPLVRVREICRRLDRRDLT